MSKCSMFLSHLETAVEALNAANAAKGFDFLKKEEITTAAHAGDQVAKHLTDILLALDNALERLAATAKDQGIKPHGTIGDASGAFFTAGRAANAVLSRTAKAIDAAYSIQFPAINQ